MDNVHIARGSERQETHRDKVRTKEEICHHVEPLIKDKETKYLEICPFSLLIDSFLRKSHKDKLWIVPAVQKLTHVFRG